MAACLADVEPAPGGPPVADPRGAVRRAVAGLAELGLAPVVGPELEFFLVERDPSAPGGIRRRVDRPSMVYTVGPQADPGGLVRAMTEALAQIGLEASAVSHEFMAGQYEINLRHTGALTAADRAFRLKAAVKDMAAQHGLVATFMGKPFNDQGGSGAHLHISLEDDDGRNALDAPDRPHGVAPVLGAFTAGLLAHAPALTALLAPTVNAYRRLRPDALAPTHANWGWDNRTTFVRVPPERGAGTRVEVRAGDGAGNPYLAIAAVLAAGADGIRGRSPRHRPWRGTPTAPRPTSSAPRCPAPSTRRSTRSRPTPRSAPRSDRRSSRRSWRSSGPRAIATTPGSRTGTWPSTWTTCDARPRRRVTVFRAMRTANLEIQTADGVADAYLRAPTRATGTPACSSSWTPSGCARASRRWPTGSPRGATRCSPRTSSTARAARPCSRSRTCARRVRARSSSRASGR